MRILIVHCHPDPHSFNAGLTTLAASTLRAHGHDVDISDLYAEGFDPVEGPAHYPLRARADAFSPLTEQRHASDTDRLPSDVQREIARLERAELVIFQFPLWWHAQPAMLKGWMDRVFVYGGLYTSRRRYDAGYFRGRRALCSVTTGGPAATFGQGGRGGNIDWLLWPVHYSLYYMGFDVLPPFLAHGIQGGGPTYQNSERFAAQLEDDKARWAQRLTGLDEDRPLPFTGWNDWDEQGALKPGVEGFDPFIQSGAGRWAANRERYLQGSR